MRELGRVKAWKAAANISEYTFISLNGSGTITATASTYPIGVAIGAAD
jgi:hypothetical protein